MEHKVFVYGSLKQGESRHKVLESPEVLSYGADIMMFPGYLVKVTKSYPGLLYTGNEISSIHGEVYGINDILLKKLDRIEGHPTLFMRSLRRTKNSHMCWVYIFQNPTGSHFEPVPDNDWSVQCL